MQNNPVMSQDGPLKTLLQMYSTSANEKHLVIQ